MEVINKDYVKISRAEIFIFQVKCSDTNNTVSLKSLQNLFRVILDYEKEYKCFIKEIYIKLDSKFIKQLLQNDKLILSRETILNSIIFAVMSNNIYNAKELKKFIHKNETSEEELGYLYNFVLNNSMSIHEFFNGESEKYIFNDLKNNVEKGFVFDKDIKNKYNKTNEEPKTLFIEKSYMVASIMKINRNYLHKNYVSKRELNILTWNIQKKFNEENIKAIFVDDIDYSYFLDCGDIIMLSEDYICDFEGVEQRFQAHLPIEILSIIWDEKFITSMLIDNHQTIQENVKNF